MIYSSTDIYKLLSGNSVVSAIATVQVVDGRPSLEVSDGVIIYVSRYPTPGEFEVSWDLWIIDFSNEPLDVLYTELQRLLPKFQIVRQGEITEASVTELKSVKTELRPQFDVTRAIEQQQRQIKLDFSEWENRFEELKESIEDRMLLVSSGRPGRDGQDGRDGKDGQDGVDLLATSASIDDLIDVETDGAVVGQFLGFDGEKWAPKDIPRAVRGGGGGGGTKLPPGGDVEVVLVWNPIKKKWEPGDAPASGGIPEAPTDGRFYVRQNGQWVDLVSALIEVQGSIIDGGNFTLDTSIAESDITIDGGSFS